MTASNKLHFRKRLQDLLRLHIANLIKPLGHAELAGTLYRITHQPFARRLQDDIGRARTLLDAAPVREVEKATAFGGLIGGVVTRAGPAAEADIAPADQEALARLNLRPVFVGIERDLIRAVIEAEPQPVRARLTQMVRPDEFARPDRAGGWIVPLGEATHQRRRLNRKLPYTDVGETAGDTRDGTIRGQKDGNAGDRSLE